MSSLLKINSAIARLDGKKFGFYRALRDIGAASNVQPNDETYSGLLQLCYKERLFNESRALFNEISNPTVNHFNQLVRVG